MPNQLINFFIRRYRGLPDSVVVTLLEPPTPAQQIGKVLLTLGFHPDIAWEFDSEEDFTINLINIIRECPERFLELQKWFFVQADPYVIALCFDDYSLDWEQALKIKTGLIQSSWDIDPYDWANITCELLQKLIQCHFNYQPSQSDLA